MKLPEVSRDKLYLKIINKLAVPFTLISLLLMVLLYIEFRHPYFFLQDDNRDYYLPYFIHNYESLLKGEIALYNFHQFMGEPILALGQSAVLYPITYLSVFLSNLFFGHYYAAIDIQVILHLLIGAAGFYRLIRFFDIERKAAFFAGLTWPLSSFVIYASNSWVIVAGVAAYFPWMLLFSFHLYKKPSLKTAFYAVIVRLLLFYAGHIQYFIYSVIFEFITATIYVISGSEAGRKMAQILKFLKVYIAGYICVFVFSLPLLLPMWHQTTISAQRSKPLPFEVFASEYYPVDQLLKGLFYPFLQVNENTYASSKNLLNLSHIGYLTIILLSVLFIERYIVRSKKFTITSVKLSVFVLPALIAFLWATNCLFNKPVYIIPILNRFRWPFKLAIYLDFYLIAVAAFVLSHIIAHFSWKAATKKILFSLIIGIQILNFVLLYTVSPYKDFGEHHSDSLPLQEKLKDKLNGGRIISIGFDTWYFTPQNNHGYLTAPTLAFNYATLWGLDYFAGYEPLLSSANSEAVLGLNFTAIISPDDTILVDYLRKVVDYLRKAAVKWYIFPANKEDEYAKKFNAYGIVKKYADENRVVFYDTKAYDMVFYSDGEKINSTNYRVTTNTIELNVDNRQSDIVVFNYLYNSFFKCYVDGKEAELKPVDKIHFSVSVPEGKHHIMVRYSDPYLLIGTHIALGFLTIILIVWMFVSILKRKAKIQTTDNLVEVYEYEIGK